MRKILNILAIGMQMVTVNGHLHHSVLHYDGKTEVKISGIVAAARFGFPHSVYRIDVTNEDGTVEKWVLSTEDPRDAERLGFRDEIAAINGRSATDYSLSEIRSMLARDLQTMSLTLKRDSELMELPLRLRRLY